MTTAPDQRLRASDTDRERIAQRLRTATGAGMLTLPEADERLGAAYAARYTDDLVGLTADLPPVPRARTPRVEQARSAAARVQAMALPVLLAIWALVQRHKVIAAVAGIVVLVLTMAVGFWALTVPELLEG